MMQLLATCALVLTLALHSQSATVLSSGTTGYEYFPGFGFYKHYSENRQWGEAVQTCLADGGQLGIVNSEAEAELYRTIIARYSKDGFMHVGLTEFHDSGEFLTLDGVPLDEVGYSKWAPGEPNNDNKGENCMSLTVNGELNDISCTEELWFMCELRSPVTSKVV